MFTQQTHQFKLCTRDYITTMLYILLEDSVSFLKTFLTDPDILEYILWEWV